MPARERPLDSDGGPLAEFAAALRQLRDQAGSPPYRELGRRAHYSAGTLSEAASGRKLPTLAVTLAYVQACDGDTADWEHRWHRLAAALATPAGPEPGSQSPYLGLAAFQAEDCARFFGRERLIDDLYARLTTRRFLAVFGPSGAGKSSLLRAGLLPRFTTTILFTPGAHPLAEFAIQLAPHAGTTAGRLHTELAQSPDLVIRQATKNLVVVVDQFEEIFTLCTDPEERSEFVRALLAATIDGRVVIGMRSDFYTQCAEHPELTAALSDSQVLVGQMTASELRSAITQPAIQAGFSVEGDLVAQLIAEAGGRVGALPLMSHALRETWHRRRGTTLTLNGYHAAGGIQGCIAQTAEAHYTALDKGQQTKVRQLFLRLVALDSTDTKRRIHRCELDADDPDIELILSRLTESRLITVDSDTIEVTHESLFTAWPRLGGWLTEDRETLRIQRQLTEASATWESLDRDPGALYRGSLLATAKESPNLTLAPREREFLNASIDAANAAQRIERKRIRELRWLAVSLTILLVATAGLAVLALSNQRSTEEQRQIGLSRELAAQATAVAQQDTGQAMQLAIKAVNASPTIEARSALLSVAGRPATNGMIPATGEIALSNDGSMLAISSVQTSSDGREAESDKNVVKMWDLVKHTEITTLSQGTRVTQAMAISNDRTLLVVGSDSGSLRVWTLTVPVYAREQKIPVPDDSHPSPTIQSVAISNDNTRIATMDLDGTVRLWDTRTLTQLRWWPGPGNQDREDAGRRSGMLRFTPDGRTLITSAQQEITFRDTVTGETKQHLDVADWPFALTPEGDRIAASSRSGGADVGIWDVDTLQLVGRLPISGLVTGLAFDHGNLVVSGQRAGTTIWSTDHSSPVRLSADDASAVASANGTIVVVGPASTTIWNLARLPVLAFGTPDDLAYFNDTKTVYAAGPTLPLQTWDTTARAYPKTLSSGIDTGRSVFSPDRSRLATTQPDGRTAVLNTRTGNRIVMLETDRDTVPIGFGSEGKTLATATTLTEGQTDVTIWDAETGKAVTSVTDGPGKQAYGNSGRMIATFSQGRIRVWDAATRQLVANFQTLPNKVESLAFDPAGTYVYAGYEDGRISVWDTARKEHIIDLPAHTRSVTALSPSPNHAMLASGSKDNTVVIWDTKTWQRLATLTGHTGSVSALGWSADNGVLVSGSVDGTIIAWPTEPGQAIRQLCTAMWADFPQRAEQMPGTCPR
ncbi:helix-turn-helix domain-containing protein [Actinocrispum sp. NPDC049592]|uniref:nSTAND1 domain-containing NTPase n=1 Tax=Actinocrispum sp. NPDC049592 TaxID=3154835 RepID=UPI0034428746